MFKIISICKGGGYRYCRTSPPHPKRNAKGLYPLHRVRMENKLGRLLEKEEEVHHKDEDKTNDSIGNLEVKTKSEHSRHHKKEVESVKVKCECGVEFSLKPYAARLRSGRNKKGVIYCSRKCSGIFSR